MLRDWRGARMDHAEIDTYSNHDMYLGGYMARSSSHLMSTHGVGRNKRISRGMNRYHYDVLVPSSDG